MARALGRKPKLIVKLGKAVEELSYEEALALGKRLGVKSERLDDIAREAEQYYRNATRGAVAQAGEAAKRFLGKDYRVITNKAGDKIFLSKNGARRIRFDINRSYPHKNSHLHIEELINGKWCRRQIFPIDVIPE